jgi:hypothetical protein
MDDEVWEWVKANGFGGEAKFGWVVDCGGVSGTGSTNTFAFASSPAVK